MMLILTNAGMYRGIGGVRNFLIYNAFLLVAATAVMLRGSIPEPLSIVGATTTFFIAYFYLLRGLEDLFGISPWQRMLQGVLVLAGFAIVLQYGLIHPNTSQRLAWFSLVLGLQQWNTALVILARSGTKWKIGLPMSVMLLMLGLANLIRLVGVGFHGAPSNYLDSGFFLQAIVITTTCLQCGVIVAYVWITMALLRQDLEVQASTDALTGTLNRRAVEMVADRELLLSRRKGSRLSALALDLDNFKQINDRHGHHCGDAVLVAVAQCLRGALREGDQLARVGGDEFLAVLPKTSLETAGEIAERVRVAVAELQVRCGDEMESVTASVGFAELTDDSEIGWDHMMTRCDQAMYSVKRAGGNQTLTSPV
ncbi:GGDEF domain-containing protein [Terriglobus roseus]|nr:GGDEF domain-containing protein [Terriglobus roseus]